MLFAFPMNKFVRSSSLSSTTASSMTWSRSVVIMIFLVSASVSSFSQVVIDNGKVSYTYEAGPSNALLPSSPLAVATDVDSSISFYPTDFKGTLASSDALTTGAVNAVISLSMDAKPGQWFSGTALAMTSSVSYSLYTLMPSSEAGLFVSIPFLLSVTSVDQSPFGSPSMQLATNMTMSVPNVMLNTPYSSTNGFVYGVTSFNINQIKSHFGIAASNNVTGLRVQLEPSGFGWAQRGGMTGSLAKFDVVNQVVPEPSTYALLFTGAVAAGFCAWRRRR